MILRLVIIALIACFVFWLIKRGLPTLRQHMNRHGGARRILPFILNPVAFRILRRGAIFILRLIFRR